MKRPKSSMLSDTIWSNGNGVTSPHHQPSSNYRSVLDQVDPDVAKMLANSAAASSLASTTSPSAHTHSIGESRRFSFDDGENNIFGFKKESLPAIGGYAASTGGVHHHPQAAASVAGPAPNPPHPHLGFGTASISGGIASRHPPQDSFLQKFSSVADATRDIELSNNLGKLTMDSSSNPTQSSGLPSSRRTSFNQTDNQVGGASLLTSPRGSLNENLNMPAARTSRHQSISEKIDHYNSTSPIQASAALSVSSDLNSNIGLNPNQQLSNNNSDQKNNSNRFWSPATATAFTPNNSYNYFIDNSGFPHAGPPPPPPGQGFNPYVRTGPPPQFMVPSPPPQFMDPNFYQIMNYNNLNNPNSVTPPEMDNFGSASSPEKAKPGDNGESAVSSDDSENHKEFLKRANTPGIGLINRQMAGPGAGFMFAAFNPYSVYQQSPPLPNNVTSGETSPTGDTASPTGNSSNPPLSQPGPIPTAGLPSGGPPPMFMDPNMMPPIMSSRSIPPVNPSPNNSKPSRKERNGSKNPNSNNGKNGANHIYRSPLLEEVRSNSKGKEYYLRDIYGHAVEFTKDQHGSRFIQQKLPDATEEEKEVIFNEIRDISYELMTDVFGNYVIQKYFEHGSTTQQKILLEYMDGHIYELSLQMYGCRVIQRALEAIELNAQIKIINELKDYVLICAKDQNGNHVIQKSIEKIPFGEIKFILDSLDNQIYHLSTHPYGCRVIQRLLEHSSVKDQKKILDELNRFIFYLIQDQYGNYVMQHILERGNPEDREEILKVVLGSVVNFSKHKFASNVIEKCIKYGSLSQRKRILHEVMVGNEDINEEMINDDSALALMVKDQYANYVIQKLVEGFDAKSDEKKRLVAKLRQYLKQISSKNTYGKHLASVEKMIIVAENALIEAEKAT